MDKKLIEHAKKVQAELSELVAGKPGIKGIGIGLTKDRKSVALEVLLEKASASKHIPKALKGITVTHKVVGKIKGQD